jgi:hypothetical protein
VARGDRQYLGPGLLDALDRIVRRLQLATERLITISQTLTTLTTNRASGRSIAVRAAGDSW